MLHYKINIYFVLYFFIYCFYCTLHTGKVVSIVEDEVQVCNAVELDRYIGNTHHRGLLWDNRNHRQMMTISDQFVPMFHDDVTH